MPTATPFVYPKLFSPGGHCVEDKTTAQLDALTLSRIEKTDLSDIMAFWWNLNTAIMTLQMTGYSSESFTSNEVTDAYDGSTPRAAITPRDRICTLAFDSGDPNDGPVFWKNFVDEVSDSVPLKISFQRVYYNTTTSKYALGFLLLWGAGPRGNLLCTDGYGDANGTPSVTNGSTVTIFGTTIATKRISSLPDTAITIDNPIYYTY